MSWEPITYCRECDEPLDVYLAFEERYCESCMMEAQESADEEPRDCSILFGPGSE